MLLYENIIYVHSYACFNAYALVKVLVTDKYFYFRDRGIHRKGFRL